MLEHHRKEFILAILTMPLTIGFYIPYFVVSRYDRTAAWQLAANEAKSLVEQPQAGGFVL